MNFEYKRLDSIVNFVTDYRIFWKDRLERSFDGLKRKKFFLWRLGRDRRHVLKLLVCFYLMKFWRKKSFLDGSDKNLVLGINYTGMIFFKQFKTQKFDF
jgi:hypothetical protein